MSNNQQIIISGLGGQGVLFITKLLAGAAMADNLPVLVITSYSIHYTKLYEGSSVRHTAFVCERLFQAPE